MVLCCSLWLYLGRNSEKHAQPPPLGRGLEQGEPGRRFPAAGAGASWGRQAAPKITSSRASGTKPQLRHGERARKPSSFWKSVHYNKSYGPETPIGSIQFTAIAKMHLHKIEYPPQPRAASRAACCVLGTPGAWGCFYSRFVRRECRPSYPGRGGRKRGVFLDFGPALWALCWQMLGGVFTAPGGLGLGRNAGGAGTYRY